MTKCQTPGLLWLQAGQGFLYTGIPSSLYPVHDSWSPELTVFWEVWWLEVSSPNQKVNFRVQNDVNGNLV